MFSQSRNPGTTAAPEPPNSPRARVPQSRRVTLPRGRTQASVHTAERAHPDSIAHASGTTSRRAAGAPTPRRIRI